MAITRKIKTGRKRVVIKRRPQLSEWELLYNRLQDEDSDFAVYAEVAKHVSGSVDCELFDLFEMLLAKFDARVETLQMNYPEQVSWRVSLSWANPKSPIVNGYRSRLYVIKTSPHLWRSTTLAYLEICKNAVAWI